MEARTLGQLVVDEQIVADLAKLIARLNTQAAANAKMLGKREQLPAVSCFTCTAKKACCHSIVVARLFEGVVVAAHLRDAGRDTPELRAQLAEAATAMEAAAPVDWNRPCAFLGEGERCTIYAARPTPCGALHVYTPATWCGDRAAEIKAYPGEAENAIALQLEDQFRERLSLRKKVGRRYIGVLPRMVLLALEAWDRTDFRDFLRLQPWPTDAEAARWSRRSP